MDTLFIVLAVFFLGCSLVYGMGGGVALASSLFPILFKKLNSDLDESYFWFIISLVMFFSGIVSGSLSIFLHFDLTVIKTLFLASILFGVFFRVLIEPARI